MIKINEIIKVLKKNNVDFFTGVPDSILKSLSSYLEKNNKKKHIIATNEGSAIAIGIGHYLSTENLPVIYLQNSGLGNIVNPVVSIAHKKVYGIPMLLFVGWRGAPNLSDEIQHKVQGRITLDLLNLIGIKYCIINNKNFAKQLTNILRHSKKNKQPVACLFKKGDLQAYEKENFFKQRISNKLIRRENFLKKFISLNKNYKVVATTGFTSRELYQIREKYNTKLGNDFYMVGGMGHTSMVAFGYSMFSNKKVVCLDGDGSFLMHLGSAGVIARHAKKNYKYILLNNGCHESVGGQPTIASNINIKKFSNSLGYKNYYLLSKESNINSTLKRFLKSKGPSFLEVKIRKGSLKKLLRIKNLKKIKKAFIYK